MLKSLRTLKPAFQPLLLALVFGALAWRESHEAWFAPVQRGYVEWLQGNASGSHPKEVPVLLVEINDGVASGESGGAWQPVDFAIALNTVLPLQPDVLAIAPVLSWPLSGSDAASADAGQYLRVLHDKLLATSKPLLAARLGFPEDPDIAPPIEAVPAIRAVSGDITAVPEYPFIVEKADETLRLAGQTGFLPANGAPAHAPVPLLFRYHGQIVPSFALQAAVLRVGATLDEVSVSPGAIQIGGALRIPVDAAGQLTPNAEATFRRVSFDDLMLGVTKMQAGQSSAFKSGALKNDIVLLARAEPGAQIAAALATIITQAYPRPLSIPLEALCLLPVCWLVALVPRWSRERGLLAILSAALAYAVLVLTIYGGSAIVLPLLAPLAVLLLGVVLALGRRAG